MRILERIIAMVIVVALVMKFSFIPGGDSLLLFAAMTLAGIYFPLGFLLFNHIRLRDIFKNTSNKNVTPFKTKFATAGGAGLSTIIIGGLFKLLDFTGADAMLVVGLSITAIAAVVAVVLFVKNNDADGSFMLWRAGIIGGIGIVLLLTSSLTLVKFQYRDHPAYIEAYTNYSNDHGNEELFKKLDLERNRIKLTEEEFRNYEKAFNKK